MKQEIIAFAFLPWIIYFLETYIEKKESKYFTIYYSFDYITNKFKSLNSSVNLYLFIN